MFCVWAVRRDAWLLLTLFPSVPPGSCPELAALWSVEFNNRKEETHCEHGPADSSSVCICADLQKGYPIMGRNMTFWKAVDVGSDFRKLRVFWVEIDPQHFPFGWQERANQITATGVGCKKAEHILVGLFLTTSIVFQFYSSVSSIHLCRVVKCWAGWYMISY